MSSCTIQDKIGRLSAVRRLRIDFRHNLGIRLSVPLDSQGGKPVTDATENLSDTGAIPVASTIFQKNKKEIEDNEK